MSSPPIVTTGLDRYGWTDSIEIQNDWIQSTIITAVGPRILDFRFKDGSNLLYVRSSEAGLCHEPSWVFRGGWRLWMAPERPATTYAPDNEPCEVTVPSDRCIEISGPLQQSAGIRKHVSIEIAEDAPRIDIRCRIENMCDRSFEVAPWSLPVLRPGGRAFVPLDRGLPDAFDSTRSIILWSYASIHDSRYRYSDDLVEIDTRVVGPVGAIIDGRRTDESKIGVDSKQGWAAYLIDHTLFVKRFHSPSGLYVDGGATIEIYSCHEFLELEHLGPLVTVPPAKSVNLRESWWLFADVSISEPASRADLEPYLHATALHEQ